MKLKGQKLALSSLLKAFWGRVTVTWTLTLFETFLLAALPLLMGLSIDGLLNDNWTPFIYLMGAMGLLLVSAVGRRLYDTRAYGTMRVELGKAVVEKGKDEPVSTVNARLTMSRELVSFLEEEMPILITAVVQVIVSIAVLWSFHGFLAAAAGGATVAALLIYGVAGGRFFRLNGDLNTQTEKQVTILDKGIKEAVATHLLSIRRHEVRLSDTEAVVYGLIFAVLMAMLSFNLWFATTQTGASPGQIFSIVTYSFEFIESAVMLPIALQSLTRISEITERINREMGSGDEATPA